MLSAARRFSLTLFRARTHLSTSAIGKDESIFSSSSMDMDTVHKHLKNIVIANIDHSKTFTGNRKEVKLEPRYRSASVTRVVIPLSSREDIRLNYLSSMGSVRLGKLLEDIDNTAVYVCYKHNASAEKAEMGTLPRTIVTASVHRIKVEQSHMHPHRDILIDGFVTWTGRSTMQCTMKLFQDSDQYGLVQLLKAQFIMASRDPRDTAHSAPVHQLLSRTPGEATQFNYGAETALERSRMRARRAENNDMPSAEEFQVLHSKYSSGTRTNDSSDYQIKRAPNQSWMSDTALQNTRICHPENQNVYGKIFGGFLMREALELAMATAKIYSKSRVETVSIDDISFEQPVEIGHILRIDSLITYTEKQFMQARVFAEVFDERMGYARKTTDIFHFTFRTVDNKEVNDVLFKNYYESMLYLDGKRRFQNAIRHLRT